MFPRTQRFVDAISVVNGLPVDKCSVVIERIASKVHKDDRLFTESEESQLPNVLEIADKEVKKVLDVTSYVFEQAAYNMISPENLESSLLEAGVNAEKTGVICSQWSLHGKDIIAALRERGLKGKHEVDNVKWRLNVCLADEKISTEEEVSAIFDFGDAISVEFDKEEMTGFYDKIEDIQRQFDALQ